MKTKTFLFIIILLAAYSSTVFSQNNSPIIEIFKKAVSKREKGWRIDFYRAPTIPGYVRSADLSLVKGKERISMSITAFPTDVGAKNNFNNLQEYELEKAKVEIVGDQGFLWNPDKERGVDEYILRFRKSGAIVSLLSTSEELCRRFAKYIADDIPSLEKYMQIVPQPPITGDFCHVYIVDVEKAKSFSDTNFSSPELKEKAEKEIETVFPEFRSDIGEESLTTKTYPFPNSNLFITASIYYTDEMMASAKGADSMMLAIAVSSKENDDALDIENNAMTEITFAGRDTVRVKKYQTINGRLYLIGLQCRSDGTKSLD